MGGFLTFIRELLAACGGVVVITLTLGRKLLDLAYDTFKQKLTSDIEKDRLKFVNELDERLKYVENNIAQASHAATTQYDREANAYSEILKALYASSLDVENLYKVYPIADKEARNTAMQKLHKDTLEHAEACTKACEESASFIRPEVCNAIRQYVLCIRDLEFIHRQCKYGIQEDCSVENQERAKLLKTDIELKMRTIQDAIRTRLDQLGTVSTVL